jgi:hypothetical protein
MRMSVTSNLQCNIEKLEIEWFLFSSTFFVFSNGVLAIRASMQHIFPFIHIERNPKDAKTSEKAETTSKEALKSTDSFLSRGEDFCIAVRTSRPNRIWS